jgi:hypothetical protein
MKPFIEPLQRDEKIPYTLDCKAWNLSHVRFNVFDGRGANCGTVTIDADDVRNFVALNWNGNVKWNGHPKRN